MLCKQSCSMVGLTHQPIPTNRYQGGEQKAMAIREACPQCASQHFKQTGHIHTGKQNHRCKACGRQFVMHAENRLIDEEQCALVARLLLEKISLHGICRAVGVSIRWLMDFMGACFDTAPAHLHVQGPSRPCAAALPLSHYPQKTQRCGGQKLVCG